MAILVTYLLGRRQSELEIEILGGQICHKMIEHVRRVEEYPKHHDWHENELHEILGEMLPRYTSLLSRRSEKVHVTVKQVRRNKSVPDKAVAVYRSPSQGDNRLARRETKADECWPMKSFDRHASAHPGDPRQLQLIHEGDVVNMKGMPEEYTEQLARHSIATVLAFPIRTARDPEGKEGGSFSRLIGFYSLDCPKAHSFRELFDKKGKTSKELDVFFTVADALATIFMLEKRPSEARN